MKYPPLTVYIIETDFATLFVRENAPATPMLHITYGDYDHLYHKEGFKFDKEIRALFGEKQSQIIDGLFEQADVYMKDNPEPWNTRELKSYKTSN